MKIHRLIVFVFTCAILLVLAVGLFISADHPETVFARFDQDRDRTAESYEAASMSKSTILLLLAVGVIGALGVNRKKKGSGSDRAGHAEDQASQRPMVNEQRKTDQP